MNDLEKKPFYIYITPLEQSSIGYFSSRLMRLVAFKKGLFL